ncbi:MAG TPA: DEAD/DEAH box helicase [Fluviicoccus sp.]|nr:DEAD/DEAH box helicase [Fluviicoccus sp.]
MTTVDQTGSDLSVSIAIDSNAADSTPVDVSAFINLGLHEALGRALADLKIHTPTPVQAQAIPVALQGRDLLVSSQTGSGKTAAFMLPALQKISEMPAPARASGRPERTNGRRPRPEPARPTLVVLTPTRELAQQVTSATTSFTKYMRRIVCTSIVGGMPYPRQLDMLAKMPDILVATPGRLLDHMGSGRIDLSNLSMLVFDEADRMLDMGFSEDIDAIMAQTPETRQTLMFSATMQGRIAELASDLLKDPVRISIEQQQLEYDRIEQRLHFVDDAQHKAKLLAHLLADDSLQQAIIFTGTKLEADELADDLVELGYAASALHGDMKQSHRNRTLQGLRRGEIKVLVATDVAARGIDVPNISHVVNYALPRHSEDYIHRIGRTGRAGRSGIAVNLVHHGDRYKWVKIERMLPARVNPSEVEGLEPQRAPKPRSGRPGDGYRSGGGGRDFNGGSKERWSRDRKDSRPAPRSGDRSGPRTDDRAPRFDDTGFRRDGGYRNEGGGYRGASAPAGDRPYADRAPRGDDRGGYAPRRDDNFGNRPEGRREGAGGYAGRSDQPRREGGGFGAPRSDAPRRDSNWQDRPRRQTSGDWERR